MLDTLKGPRFWLLTFLVVGGLGLLYVIIAASVKPRSVEPLSALEMDNALLVGEMANFEYAFPPRGAPQIAFDRGDEKVSLADFRGKAVLVNFWATWCAPCLKELPSLDALQDRLGGRNFEVVAIAADPKGPEAAQSFLDRLKIKNLDLYADPRLAMATSIGGSGALPVSILYDAKGREVGRLVGEADWASEEAVRLVSSVIPN
ncbi:MAG: redoxin family protein [Pseudomonadota bacterium]